MISGIVVVATPPVSNLKCSPAKSQYSPNRASFSSLEDTVSCSPCTTLSGKFDASGAKLTPRLLGGHYRGTEIVVYPNDPKVGK